MTMYCQHAHRMRFNRPPGLPDLVSERPRANDDGAYLDGKEGTTVIVPDDAVGFNLAMSLASGALVEIPCPDHPEGRKRQPPGHAISPSRKLTPDETAQLKEEQEEVSTDPAPAPELMEDGDDGESRS